ncbi:hypothetical protein B9479_004344 [Cryptococcus floricola]|uniref:Ricin B lectin domain-containing protein n=1 Tax=Cryptococcus floricola TaxID=2591691 RepID=A0A5D3AVQ8_9TREE|nr:hypothetical protein B9479_004344 [Cryptococcus floricola]
MLSLIALLPLLALTSATPLPRSDKDFYQGVKLKNEVGNFAWCLTPYNEHWHDGTNLTSNYCSEGELWDIHRGSGSILVHGTEWALDSGTAKEDGNWFKIWTSYPGIDAQSWYYTDDNHIAVLGGTQCIQETISGPRSFACNDDPHQVYTIVYPGDEESKE